MHVVKRNGSREAVQFDKITERLRKLALIAPPAAAADVSRVAQQVCGAVHDGIATATLDVLAADVAAGQTTEHPDYGTLAARILVSNLHKNTTDDVLQTYETLRDAVAPAFLAIVRRRAAEVQTWLDFSRDYAFDYFGIRTLEKSYLLKVPGTTAVVERPQHMFLRVALGIWGDATDEHFEHARETYAMLAAHKFTHASPTLFNAGTPAPQLASCFLIGIHVDSLDAIFEAFHKIARVSKFGGGIGLHVHGVRARGSLIRSTNGVSDGLVPMLKVVNEVVRYVNQSGRRKGSCAVYLEPHHADIMEFLELRRNQGDDHMRARDLFYALWISDLFMERVEVNAPWSLFDPGTAPGLEDVWGDAYRALYERYEAEGRAVRVLPAQDVWFAALRLQIEAGVPYVLFKDACNAKSNQQNLGTIKSSNLCSEIIQYTAEDEIAVCNLGSMSLPAFVIASDDGRKGYDYAGLHAAAKVLARNLDRVVDVTMYPVDEALNSNARHRPIGIGVQGLADVFFALDLPFDSEAAAEINRKIFATVYHAAVETSIELAATHGAYASFAGSPASEGRLQFDLWNAEPHPMYADWEDLRRRAAKGMRNSLLVAPMPTATTAQILGNNEAFEPVTSNLYSRTTMAGTFIVVNGSLQRDLVDRGLWTKAVRDALVANEGSVQNLEIPDALKAKYKTAYEMSMKTLIDMAADRGVYVDQSMSLNMFVAEPTFRKLSSMLFYAWRKGLKTGMYYLRSRGAATAVKITVENAPLPIAVDEGCVACSG